MKKNIFSTITFALCLLFGTMAVAQEHAFTPFNAGTLASNTTGITTPMSVAGLSGSYLIYTVHADFNGLGNTAWSNSIQMEITNGGSVKYASLANAKSGAMANANATTLSWTGVMEQPYTGGTPFSVRFFDNYDDASGPYTCTLTNVRVTVYEASVSHTFSTFNAGTLLSNNTGIETTLAASGLTSTYLFYSVSADFVGTANPAWSNSIHMELSNGSGSIYKPDGQALSGFADSPAATTLHWSGLMHQPYTGGGTFKIRFVDDYDDASGPYSSSITNVQVTIYEVTEVHVFPTYNPATLLSNNAAGVTNAMSVAGLTDDYLFYHVATDWVGVTADPAWSNSMQMELNNGGSKVYADLANAMAGAMSNASSTSLLWTGVMNDVLPGGDPLTVRFFDNYDDASGPYSSSFTNTVVTIYTPAQCPLPVASFTNSAADLAVSFTDATTNAPTSRLWDFGDGNTSTQQNPTHNYAAPGTYTVCLTATNSCGTDSSCGNVTVTCPPPVVAFSDSTNSYSAFFTNNTTGGATSYLWDFGDGNTSTATNPNHTYAASGTYTVCLTATSVCGTDSSCSWVNISCPVPATSWSHSANDLSVDFTDATTNSPFTWLWDFGDGNTSSLQNPTHNYSVPGVYTVCLTTVNACGADSSCGNVAVTCPAPLAAFNDSISLYTAYFTDNTTGSPTSWTWDFGDGSTSSLQNPTHVFPFAGSYIVCLIASSACGSDTICDTVSISCPLPVTAWSNSNSGNQVSFIDMTTNSPTSWLWDFGDGNTSTQQNPTHIYPANGTYTVCLTTTNGCGSDSSCAFVTYCPTSTSSFSVARCGSYTVPSGDETHTTSGTYMDTIPNVAGCDSIMTIAVYIDETPTITHFTSRGTDQFRVRWEYLLPVTINDTNFRIRAWESGFPVAYTDKSQFPGNFQKKFTGLDDNTWYNVKIGFACEDGSFVWGNTDSVKTKKLQCSTVTGQMQDLPLALNTATISWSDNGAASYKIRSREVGALSWNFSTVAGTSKTLAGLTPGTDYEYQVKAQCNNGLESSYGTLHTFSTEGIGVERLAASTVDEFNVYPNPSSGEVVLEVRASETPAQLILTDVSGRTVHTESLMLNENYRGSFNFDVQAGSYILRVVSKDFTETIKLEIR